MNKTKIVARISNENYNKEVLKKMIINGIDAFCFDLNKISLNYCKKTNEIIHELNKEMGMFSSTMIETIGPRIHTSKFNGGSAIFKEDDKIRVYMNEVLGDETKLSVDYQDLLKEVKYDTILKFMGSSLELEVLDKGEDFLLCKVINSGTLTDYNVINVIGSKLDIPFLTDIDRKNIEFASKNYIDYIAVSYISGIDDVLEVNDLLIDLNNNHLGIISKIENEFVLDELDEVINISDGVLLVRDSLGIEIPIERIPGIQKLIINKCHLTGKISIVGSDMLTSTNIDDLSKAEVSDIANAVLDGTDAVLLNDNFIIDDYPIDTLEMTEKIIRSAEIDIDHSNFLDRAVRSEEKDVTGSVACSVASISSRLKCKAIVAPTISGYTAKKMSRFRPVCPVIAISTDINTVRSLSIYFGVYPILIDELKSLDDVMKKAKKLVMDNIDVVEGDKIIITGGYPFQDITHTNLIEIEEF